MDRQIEDVRVRTFRPGDVIFRQGDPARGEVYLVHEGTVEVRSRSNGEEEFFRILRHGDLLRQAVALACRRRARVILLHVMTSPSPCPVLTVRS